MCLVEGIDPLKLSDCYLMQTQRQTSSIYNIYLPWQYSVVMVSVLASSEVDRGFEPRSGQTKDYKIGIYCFR
jgi:hypothetical protein